MLTIVIIMTIIIVYLFVQSIKDGEARIMNEKRRKLILIVILVIGVALIVAAIVIQSSFKGNADIQQIESVVKELTGEGITPQTASSLLNEGITLFSEPISLEELLSGSVSDADIAKLISGLRLFASTPTLLTVGIVLTVLGLAALLLPKMLKGRK